MGEHESGSVLEPDDEGRFDVEAMGWARRAALPRRLYEEEDGDDISPPDKTEEREPKIKINELKEPPVPN
jgi:hypothetical protein